jgi:hypothetical protein
MSFMFNLDDYETVAQRVIRFQKLHLGGRIVTEVVKLDPERAEVLCKASVYREHEDTEPAGVDYAFGIASTYPVSMRKFYVEDTITSAVGRALSLVLETNQKPTREDMQKVQSHDQVKADIAKVKAKMAQSSGEYVPVAKEDDPWTIREAAPAQTVEQAVDMVKSIIGGTTDSDIQTCIHGEMSWKTGTTKQGKPWGHWRCMNHILGEAERCEPRWYEIASDGTWKPQVKRG